MSVARVLGIGEILWDRFPDGAKFGGAPANFAAHCAALGAEVAMFSAVGKDELGTRALQELRQRGINTDQVLQSDFPTGTVDVHIDSAGVASYEFAPDCAWDHLAINDGAVALASNADIICFGSLGQRSSESQRTIQALLEAAPKTALRIFDVNLRQNFYSQEIIRQSLEVANILKLNDEEIDVVAVGEGGMDLERLRAVRQKYDLQYVALTRGEHGAAVLSTDDLIETPGIPTSVQDTVGAGDAFTAALAMGLFSGVDHAPLVTNACKLAAFVCSQKGATPALPAHLREMFV
jgi:fructokinase